MSSEIRNKSEIINEWINKVIFLKKENNDYTWSHGSINVEGFVSFQHIMQQVRFTCLCSLPQIVINLELYLSTKIGNCQHLSFNKDFSWTHIQIINIFQNQQKKVQITYLLMPVDIKFLYGRQVPKQPHILPKNTIYTL